MNLLSFDLKLHQNNNIMNNKININADKIEISFRFKSFLMIRIILIQFIPTNIWNFCYFLNKSTF